MDESGKLRVEILTFEGCQNAAITRDRLKLALEMEHLDARIEEIDVCSAELAEQMRFLGSPSVRVNDEDVKGTPEASKYGLMCRTYSGSTDDWRARLRRL